MSLAPKRLAETEQQARANSEMGCVCLTCDCATVLDLIAHIRDLEAQLAAARPYMNHKRDCGVYRDSGKSALGRQTTVDVLGEPRCNCGLPQLLTSATATPPSLSAKERQRRSFAYGNVHIDNPNVTREMVDRAAERLASEPPSPEEERHRSDSLGLADYRVCVVCGEDWPCRKSGVRPKPPSPEVGA